jgi:hypothetical protein
VRALCCADAPHGGAAGGRAHLAGRHACLCHVADGFPLHKAQQYAALRKPYLVNDVMAQDTLLDRRRVYRTLMVRHPIVAAALGRLACWLAVGAGKLARGLSGN